MSNLLMSDFFFNVSDRTEIEFFMSLLTVWTCWVESSVHDSYLQLQLVAAPWFKAWPKHHSDSRNEGNHQERDVQTKYVLPLWHQFCIKLCILSNWPGCREISESGNYKISNGQGKVDRQESGIASWLVGPEQVRGCWIPGERGGGRSKSPWGEYWCHYTRWVVQDRPQGAFEAQADQQDQDGVRQRG